MLPSEILGLTRGSYEAWCLDEAVWYFGTVVEGELEKAGQPRKKPKGAAQAEAARKRVLNKYFPEEPGAKKQFADPAAMFQSS